MYFWGRDGCVLKGFFRVGGLVRRGSKEGKGLKEIGDMKMVNCGGEEGR